MGILFGGVGEIEERGERGKYGVAMDATDARGRAGEIGQGNQFGSLLASALLAYRGRVVGANEPDPARGRCGATAQATGFLRIFGVVREQKPHHGYPPCANRSALVQQE